MFVSCLHRDLRERLERHDQKLGNCPQLVWPGLAGSTKLIIFNQQVWVLSDRVHLEFPHYSCSGHQRVAKKYSHFFISSSLYLFRTRKRSQIYSQYLYFCIYSGHGRGDRAFPNICISLFIYLFRT